MTGAGGGGLVWRKSTYSGANGCVEVAWQRSTYCSDGTCLEVGWQKATYSGENGCVEARAEHDHVYLRDSKDPEGPILTFNRAEWLAFVAGVRNDEFDLEGTG
jgi:hypothetical protein